MSSWLAYFAFRTVETVMRVLPVSVAWRAGAVLGMLGYWLSPHYRRLVKRNLTIAFGKEMAPEQITKLARKHMRHAGGNFLAGMKMPFMRPRAVHRHLQIEGIERVEDAIAAGTGVVYVLAHMGNWEILSQTAIVAPGGGACGALFQPLHNPPLNEHVLRLRRRTGCRLFNRQDGFHAPAGFVRAGGVLGVLSDQRAGETGVWCPFFSRLASTTTLPALIAKRAGAAMLPMGVITTSPGRWKIVIGEPLPPVSRDFSAEQVAAVMNVRLEGLIRQSPADWFWLHNRWKTPKSDFLLAHAKRGCSLAPGHAVTGLQPFEIVIRAPETLSDACLSVPAVRAVRRGRPDARITIVTIAKLADLWKLEPEVDDVIAIPDGANAGEVAGLLKATGREYEAGILFCDTRRAALELAQAGVPRLTGYEGQRRKRLLDQIVPPRKNPGPVQHRTREFLRIALRLGANVDDPSLHDPLPKPAGPVPQGAGVTIGLCPGGESGPAQRWPLESWADAAKLIAERCPVQWMIFGNAAEFKSGAQLSSLIGGDWTDLTGTTTLAQLAAHMCQCQAVIAHDSGPLHLAALLGVPAIGIFGPTESAHTAPIGRQHTVVRRHVECSPCFLHECPLDHRCMRELAPERVAEAVLRHCPAPAG
jgi:heptosyltransferase II